MSNPLTEKITTLYTRLAEENARREAIANSQDFAALTRTIEDAQAKQQELLTAVPDSSDEYQAAKTEMMAHMREQGVQEVDNISAKIREKKEVNAGKVLNVLGGDIDTYVSISSVTQLALKEYAKGTPDLKKDLLACVEVVAKEIVDIEVVPEQA